MRVAGPKAADEVEPAFPGHHMLLQVQPIIGTRDLPGAIDFYTRQLGFDLVFQDSVETPNYVGFRRDNVELHMQFQYEHEMQRTRLRFLIEDPDSLFKQLRERGVECSPAGIHDTAWGTREFALFDPDRNALTFYRHLLHSEKD
jgi:catechol 2,3-dioxygenase-like lactoylglutathione lyase family enzyme